jgi:glycosyltransferase involved in cell wall biosynthesis
LNYSAGSSTDYDLFHALLSHGASVRIVGPLKNVPGPFETAYRRLHTHITRRKFAKYSVAFLKQNEQEISAAIKEYCPDVIFSYFAAPLVNVRTRIPIVYAIDTTLIGSQSNWPLFSSIEYLRMLNWERKVIRKSAAIITWSKWSADILEKNYNVVRDKIAYFPIPASLPTKSFPERFVIEKEELIPLKLLLVGRDYRRKGIDIAIQMINLLNENGVTAHLRIVGWDGSDTDTVRYCGLYDKSDKTQLEEYIDHYRWAHFLIHPARFEAAGIVPSEAAAFGVPTITNAAGGLATTVKDRVSGVVLPGQSDAQGYFEILQYYIKHPDEYMQLRRSTRQRYEQELNWDITGRKIFEIIENVVVAKSKKELPEQTGK